MSQNTRREKQPPTAAPKKTQRRHWRGWLIGLGVFAGVAAAAALIAPKVVQKKLEGGDTLEMVSKHTAAELGMPAGYLPLKWEGFQVTSEGLLARSDPSPNGRELRAHRIVADASASDVRKRRIRVKSLSVQHLEMAYGQEAIQLLKDPFANPPPLLKPDADAGDSAEWETEIQKLNIQQTDLVWGQAKKGAGGLWNSMTSAERVNEGHYKVHGQEGVLRQEGWPDLRVGSFDGHYEKKTLTIEKSLLMVGDKDEVSLTGSVCDDGEMKLNLQARGCSVTPFIAETTRKKLSGNFTTDAQVERKQRSEERDEKASAKSERQDKTEKPNKTEETTAKKSSKNGEKDPPGEKKRSTEVAGKITFQGAVIRNIPALARAAEFTQIERFRRLNLDELKGTYQYSDERLKVENFELEANGLLRMEGAFTVKNQSLNGNFKLGVSETVLASFPGAKGTVFVGRRGSNYYWASLRLTGSLDHPEEDLKERLIAAAKAHYAKKLLAPILKPGKFILDTIESLY